MPQNASALIIINIPIKLAMLEVALNRLIAFDYGQKRIGMATGSVFSGNCQALKTIDNIQSQPNWKLIDESLQQWQPDALIVGLPLSMQGETTPLAKLAYEFARQLTKRYKKPVILVDERLSSSEADHILREQMQFNSRNTTSLRKKQVKSRDSIAAQLILQTYLQDPHRYAPI